MTVNHSFFRILSFSYFYLYYWHTYTYTIDIRSFYLSGSCFFFFIFLICYTFFLFLTLFISQLLTIPNIQQNKERMRWVLLKKIIFIQHVFFFSSSFYFKLLKLLIFLSCSFSPSFSVFHYYFVSLFLCFIIFFMFI